MLGLGSKQLFQLYDRLAECGLSVAAVDPFRGKPWPTDTFPPKPEHGHERWLHDGELGGGLDAARPALTDGLALLHGQGAMRVCCVGVGHGAELAINAGQVDHMFIAVGAVNPTGGTHAHFAEAACKVKVPLGLVYARGEFEPHHTQSELSKRPFGKLCVFRQVGGDRMPPGFCTAAASWGDHVAAAVAGQAAGALADFLITAYQLSSELASRRSE
ncbi:hypothetical protein HXX76_000884 [Chlamydomonas incerta]|uniref:Uncharacterized protein n=1 Tax=Chlamydomonas incerta TaxID=51695 RepID=A0A835WFJ2_CHLIN|nr:hypothetical protein HXX76_000884 [Chlamydomonas incerta]|eukprot:KAG2446296.1 hypothetical protein HXX76_000884 [Chlamydomonas incerta]